MTVLALDIGPTEFAANQVVGRVGTRDIRRIPIPANAVWDGCRGLLLDVAGDDEITAVGIACPGPIDKSAGIIAPTRIPQWHRGFDIVTAVRRLFPVAAVEVATDGLCLTLTERNVGGAHHPEAILVGAGILALLAADRAARNTPPGIGAEHVAGHFHDRATYRRADRAICGRHQPR
ncbi:ROK family protein [Nocardia sp. NPDC052112]|uniref:ROK family protein n=1 Tax=Nocardia sp. NPDC052112 TaxID=3155646 RepID=UPI0034442897